MSLRSQLLLGAAYLLVVMAITLAVPLAVNVDRRVSSEFNSGVLSNAAILASRVSDAVVAADRRTGRPSPPRQIARSAAQTARITGARVVVTDGRGRVLADTSHIAGVGEDYATRDRPEFSTALFQGRIDSRRRFSDTLGRELLLVSVPVVDRGRVVGALRISQDMGVVRDTVHRNWLGLGVIAASVAIAGGALAWLLATSLARPVRRLEGAARRLGQGDLEARATPGGASEVSTLALSFNQMADAFAANLAAQRDFVANASHQLRTPLTGLKLRLEAIRDEGGTAAAQAAKGEREVDRLNALVDDLLELARASSTEHTASLLDLGEAAVAASERWAATVAEKGKHIKAEAQTGATVWADPADIAHIFDNLIENAIRYSSDASEIAVVANDQDGHATLIVSDSGPGIPPDEQARVFERFYRGTNGRRAGAGTGLGLAIVDELARRWGGQVRLLDGPGTRVEASWPRRSTLS